VYQMGLVLKIASFRAYNIFLTAYEVFQWQV